MPPGFGLLDTALVSVPVMLALLGLIRGAPVELASCCGCFVGAAAAYLVSCLAPVHALGEPVAPLLALAAGVVTWRLTRGLSERLGLNTRWIDLGGLFDSATGCVMGGIRGIALVSAACLAYAMILVPLGLANPMQTVAYPVYLAVGSQVTSAVMASAKAPAGETGTTLASVPLPLTMPQITQTAQHPAYVPPAPAPCRLPRAERSRPWCRPWRPPRLPRRCCRLPRRCRTTRATTSPCVASRSAFWKRTTTSPIPTGSIAARRYAISGSGVSGQSGAEHTGSGHSIRERSPNDG